MSEQLKKINAFVDSIANNQLNESQQSLLLSSNSENDISGKGTNGGSCTNKSSCGTLENGGNCTNKDNCSGSTNSGSCKNTGGSCLIVNPISICSPVHHLQTKQFHIIRDIILK